MLDTQLGHRTPRGMLLAGHRLLAGFQTRFACSQISWMCWPVLTPALVSTVLTPAWVSFLLPLLQCDIAMLTVE